MVSLIVAHARQNVIGFMGDMPWSLPADLKHLKELTTGNTIIMGRKTFETLKKPLPNRRNVVLTSNQNFSAEGFDVIHSIEEIESLPGKVFIFGGSTIYKQAMHLVDEMYITVIDASFAGDTFFPSYDINQWTVESKIKGIQDDKNRYPHTFFQLTRRL